MTSTGGTYTRAVLSRADGDRVTSEFGLGDRATLSGPVARGELGQVWRLQTALGVFCVKEWFDEISRSELLEGAAFQEAAADSGVPCPRVLRSVDGRLLAEAGATTIAAYEWVDLRDRDPEIDPASVGDLVGVLHRVPFAGNQPLDPWYHEPIGRDRWDELVRELTRVRAPFAERLADLRDELVALEELIVSPTILRTGHRDLWADNLRATSDGRLCLIDWDNAGKADPTGELALVLFEFARDDPGRARALTEAYVAAGGPGRIQRPSDFTMPIAQLGHIGERQCRLWLTARGDEERTRAEAGAWEFVSEPLTRWKIGDLLDAVG